MLGQGFRDEVYHRLVGLVHRILSLLQSLLVPDKCIEFLEDVECRLLVRFDEVVQFLLYAESLVLARLQLCFFSGWGFLVLGSWKVRSAWSVITLVSSLITMQEVSYFAGCW